jgi:hypothetical protein
VIFSRPPFSAAMWRTAGGRDIHGLPHPVPSEVYDQVSRETARCSPCCAGATRRSWRDATENDPSLLVIAQAVARAFFAAC